MAIRKAIGAHKTATSTGSWDGPANEARLRSGESEAYYRRAYAWRDPEGESDVKASYRFIHHEVSAGGEPGAANVTACRTGIAVLNGARLNGARGGTTIPAEDRPGVYGHLAAHLRDADVEPPELARSLRDEPLIERRFLEAEIRAEEENGRRRIRMSIPYNVETEILWFREIIRPGAFAEAIKNREDVVAWYQHGEGGALPLGRTTAGTLELRDTNQGLLAEATPPDRPWVEDLVVSIERAEINGASFAFSDTKERWTEEPDEKPLREILATALWDISPVVFPAYPTTHTQVRSSAERVFRTYRESRHTLGDQGVAGTNDNPELVQGVEIHRRRLELVELEVRYHLKEPKK
jgi:hypothetical protein